IGCQETLIALPQAIVATGDIFRREGILPHIEGPLAFGPLHLLAFTRCRNPLYLTGRPIDRLEDVITPDEAPGSLGHRIDTLHALPAAIAGTDPRRLGFMHQLDHRPGARLNARGTWTAALLVLGKSSLDVLPPGPLQHGRQGPGILNALAGALGQEWNHRVSGITHQRHTAVRPAVDGDAVVHPGNKTGLDLIHHVPRCRLQITERAAQIVDVAALSPRSAMDLRSGHRREDAVEVLRAHPLGDQRAAGPEPVVAALFEIDRLQLLGRDQRSPHEDIGEVSRLFAAQLLADHRVNPVRTDQSITTDRLSRLQMHSHPGLVLLEVSALST